jgi:hypothetical protein
MPLTPETALELEAIRARLLEMIAQEDSPDGNESDGSALDK